MGVVVVTGASRGIGAAAARLAGKNGWAVAVNHRASLDEAEEVVDDIEKSGGKAAAIAADIADPAAVEYLFNETERLLGPVTALVNNAGINGSTGPVDELDVAATKRMFDINITGAFLCAGAAIRRMGKRHDGNGGVIVNISSAAAKHGGPGAYIDYAASKAAIDAFTYGLAREQAPEGIRVNCVRPGATLTEMNRKWMETHPDYYEGIRANVPLARAAEVEEIAEAILYMLSEKSSYSTGAILDVSGGWVCP